MKDVYMKIAGLASGNVIWQIQNSGSRFQLFFSLFLLKKYKKKIQITIPNSCSF
jgi:hypothetical protein